MTYLTYVLCGQDLIFRPFLSICWLSLVTITRRLLVDQSSPNRKNGHCRMVDGAHYTFDDFYHVAANILLYKTFSNRIVSEPGSMYRIDRSPLYPLVVGSYKRFALRCCSTYSMQGKRERMVYREDFVLCMYMERYNRLA